MRTGFKAYEIKKGHHGTNYGDDKGVTSVSNGERYPLTIVKFTRDKDKLHPTQKPVPLFEYLIKTYTNKGETVLDNCMGSGTTAIACLNTDRQYIGFELDEGYYNIAQDRIKSHIQQLSLIKEKTNETK